MGSRRMRTGDQVVVIAGNDKGKIGKILSFKGVDRVVVEGVNVRKKHKRPTQQNQKGQIIEIECPIHYSNVKLSVNGNAVKMRIRENDEGERELYYQDNKKKVAYRSVKKPKS